MTRRNVSESKVELTELIFPNDTNPLGNCMGGRVMHFMDIAAAIAARRHTRRQCVTAAVDEISFHEAVPMGSVLVMKASVNYTGRTSMEIGVRAEVEVTKTGERRHCATAYFTFVSLGDDGKPARVPDVVPETDLEKRRNNQAKGRRERRLLHR
ncbi:MAG: acyl-CoA thioesterase [Planctomycetota bacterium]|jgi:acyl-CoA hydrolase